MPRRCSPAPGTPPSSPGPSSTTSSRAGDCSEPPDPHAELRARIDRHIDAHLADPTLSPRVVAAALFVSPRHLHALFAEDGRTVAGTIRERRLERCLADLADPGQGSTPVSAIASRWGFANATRFGQLVKAATGRTPVAYRRAMWSGTSGT